MRRAIALLMLMAASAVACGGGASQTAATTPSPAASPSPSASPSPTGLQFALGGIHTSATGKIMVTATPTSTTIELVITGLASDSSHISHVHSRVEIWQDPSASGHWYVVVHAGPDVQGTNATYLMCGNLF